MSLPGGPSLRRRSQEGISHVGSDSSRDVAILDRQTSLSSQQIQAILAENIALRARNTSLERKNEELSISKLEADNIADEILNLLKLSHDTKTVDETLQVVLDAVHRILHVPFIAILKPDHEDADTLSMTMQKGFNSDAAREVAMPLSNQKGISAEAFRTGQKIYVPDVASDPRYVSIHGKKVDGSQLSIPIQPNGHIAAVLTLESDQVDAFSEREQKAVETIVLAIAEKIKGLITKAELEKAARTDPLTGLFNREVLQEKLRDEIERLGRIKDHSFCLIFLDVDKLKPINDNHGHDVGDIALQATAQAIQTSIRGTDCAVRFGGDEIIIIAEGNPQGIMAHLKSLPLSASYTMDNGSTTDVPFTVSMGAKQITNKKNMKIPEDISSAEITKEMTIQADAEMYLEKGEKRAKPSKKSLGQTIDLEEIIALIRAKRKNA